MIDEGFLEFKEGAFSRIITLEINLECYTFLEKVPHSTTILSTKGNLEQRSKKELEMYMT